MQPLQLVEGSTGLMARNYANISTAIWRNDGFRALSVAAQHAYLLLTSQPDISAAGILSLNAKRWSRFAKGITTDEVVTALNELQDHKFVVFDTETEELLVRSFVRWDGGYGNPKRRPVILRAAEEIESGTLRRWLAAEFRRLELPTDSLDDSDTDSLSASQREPPEEDMDDELFSLGNRLSDSQSGGVSPSGGVVVTKALDVSTATHNSTTRMPHAPSQATASPRARPDQGTRLPEDWFDTDDGERGAAWAKENYPHVSLAEEKLKFTNHWLSKTGKDATKRNWYRTFQNWVMEANRRQSPAARKNEQPRSGSRPGYVRMKNSHSPDRDYSEDY